MFALVVAVAMVSVGATLALRTTKLFETNVLTIGDVDIALKEDYKSEGATLTPNNATAIGKHVWVTNEGNLPCYVRVLVKKAWLDNTLLKRQVTTFTDGLTLDMIDPQFNTTDWVQGADVNGCMCFYYQKKLAVGGKTSNLMNEFYFLETDANGKTFDLGTYGGYTGVIEVQAQAIQADYIEGQFDPTTTITSWGTESNLVFNS